MRYLTDEEIEAGLARLDAADAQLEEIAARLGVSDELDVPREAVEAMLKAIETGGISGLAPEVAAVMELARTDLARTGPGP